MSILRSIYNFKLLFGTIARFFFSCVHKINLFYMEMNLAPDKPYRYFKILSLKYERTKIQS